MHVSSHMSWLDAIRTGQRTECASPRSYKSDADRSRANFVASDCFAEIQDMPEMPGQEHVDATPCPLT